MPDTSSSTILGVAAEHYVMGQLLRRNMIAALAPAGVPDADIIDSDRVGSSLWAIQVKARRDIGSDGGWHMKQKHEAMRRSLLFYCFVGFGRSLNESPQCWVVPSVRVAETLMSSHRVWLATPGKAGQQRKDSNSRRLLPHYKDMDGDPAFSIGTARLGIRSPLQALQANQMGAEKLL